MLPACGDIFYLDVLPYKEVDCLRRIQVKSVIRYSCELPMTSTAPGIANTLLLCDCNGVVESTGNLHNFVLGQAINEFRGICIRNILNQALIALKILIYITTKIAWFTLPKVLRAVYS